jgi:glycerol-3-phosphate acyltransferase PlsY
MVSGIDLRLTGSGTVSGTGLYTVAGWRPLAVAGSLDVAKGAVGPILAGRGRPILGALAGGLAITGHNWSPFLRGAGGRGVSTALGVTLMTAPEGAAVLAAGLVGGRMVRQTALGCFLASVALFPVLIRRRGWQGAVLATAVSLPMLIKRLVGNAPPGRDDLGRTVLSRMLFDRDVITSVPN